MEKEIQFKDLVKKTDFAGGNAGAMHFNYFLPETGNERRTLVVNRVVVAETNPGVEALNMSQDEIAERLVAAWNYVQGLPTHHLRERSALGITHQHRELQSANDTLMQFLKACENMFTPGAPFDLRDSPKSFFSNVERLAKDVREVLALGYVEHRARAPFLSPYIYFSYNDKVAIPILSHGDGKYEFSAVVNDKKMEVFFTEGHASFCNSHRGKTERKWVSKLLQDHPEWYPVSITETIPNVLKGVEKSFPPLTSARMRKYTYKNLMEVMEDYKIEP